MFGTRFETKYGVKMSDFEISLARDTIVEIEKLALTAYHMREINHNNLCRGQANFTRAERNSNRIASLLYQADWAVVSLHKRYIRQKLQRDKHINFDYARI